MKRPASQYYWGDWRRDTALQSCSIGARGLWHEVNCLMHDCEPYGHLMVGAGPMQPAQLARLVGITAKECTELLAELDAAGVFSRTDGGVIYSRRMVRDEALRERRADVGREHGVKGAEDGAKGAAHGSKGGRPRSRTDDETWAGNPGSKPRVETPGQNPGSEPGEEPGEEPPQNPPPAFAFASALPAFKASGTTTVAVARARFPAEAESRGPTVAGSVGAAMRQAGLATTNPGDPRFLALLEQGATEAEFVGLAAEAAAKGKGWAWVLVTLEARRREAAAVRLAPPAAPATPASHGTGALDEIRRHAAELSTPEARERSRAAREAAMAAVGRVL